MRALVGFFARALGFWCRGEERRIGRPMVPFGEWMQLGPYVVVGFGLFSICWRVPDDGESEERD